MTAVPLHNHRPNLVGNPERRLGRLLITMLLDSYDGDLIAAAEAYATAKAHLILVQMLEKRYIDRAKLYEDLIVWCAKELHTKGRGL